MEPAREDRRSVPRPYLSVGDIARRDADGFYTLVDRKSNMIICGGENVYPSEVESLLGGHPKVQDVAVIGRPTRSGARRSMRSSCCGRRQRQRDRAAGLVRHRIAGYKRPKSVVFIADEEMPRTATGKILHRVLKARYEQGA